MKKLQNGLKFFSTLCLTILLSTNIIAQKKKKNNEENLPPATSKTAEADKKSTIKPYKEVISDKAITSKGMLWAHKVEEKHYFEIPDSLLGREIMAITRASKTPAISGASGAPNYGGESLNKQVIRFEKGPENKIFIRAIQYINVSPDSASPIYKAVKNSNLDPIVAALDTKAIHNDSSSKSNNYIVEVTDLYKGDNQIFSIPPYAKTVYRIASILPDRSYIDNIKSYPINTEIKTVKTFAGISSVPTNSTTPTANIPSLMASGVLTIEINTSLVLLPKVPMAKRFLDKRIGFFGNGYTVYTEDQQRAEDQTFACRWRLEPKNQADALLQQKGIAIEPAKPIIFYIDPATPNKWKKYLKQGVDDWQKAFLKAGWKNAIRGEILSDTNTQIGLEDARYSVIRYFASNIENAYGPNVHDPRSGEIIESHIGWYHNVMKLLKRWYTTQASVIDPKARKIIFDDTLMGNLIRFVSAHEVGHTIGLRHNFGASSTVAVENLRNPQWLAEHGHTPSIMDYARFNYVAQPEDGITDLMPRIGEYDEWAIKWGYQTLASQDPVVNQQILNKQYIAEIQKNPRIWFGTETNPYDPRSQSECLGDNNMLASEYGIKNLKRILPNLAEWTKESAQDFELLDEAYQDVVGQYRRYIGHVVKNIGGVYETPKTSDETGLVYQTTPKNTQKEAINWLNTYVFETPTWLLEQSILSKIRPQQDVDAISKIQEYTLTSIFNTDRLTRLAENGLKAENYTLDEFFIDVKNSIWSELKSRKNIDPHRRNLQKAHLEKMLSLLTPIANVPISPEYRKSDVISLTRAHLQIIKEDIKNMLSIPISIDESTKYHLQDVLYRIDNVLLIK
ncbi:MAG: zinc-dependent metalloprotease [Pseudarcicella sp.]|nr:zinc-dependent metalloprotease [Pseudarcicella sp.]